MCGYKINICRPGFGATCSLCCGSHNYRMDLTGQERLFTERHNRIKVSLDDPGNEHYDVNYEGAMQCRFTGFTDPERKEAGCLVHERSGELPEKQRIFFEKVCSTFYCRSRDVLDDGEIIYAAKLTRDWYFYPLLVNNVKLLRRISRRYKNPEDVPQAEIDRLKGELLETLKVDLCGN